MKARRYFLRTAISGIGVILSLIATSLFKSWISNAQIFDLSDDAIAHLQFLTTGVFISLIISQITVAAFIIFLVLYLTSRREKEDQASV